MHQARQSYFQSILYLRGIAAILIVTFHLKMHIGRLGYDGWWPDFLQSGVDVFFVVSAFLIWLITQGRRIDIRDFYERRIRRVVPLYWMVTTTIVIAALTAPQILQTARLEPWHALASYFFIPAFVPGGTRIAPLLVPGWTLNYEMFFYFVFGLCLWLPSIARLFAVTAGLVLLVVIGWLIKPTSAVGMFWTSSLLLEFALGLVAAHLSRSIHLSLPVLYGLAAMSLLLLVETGSPEAETRWLLKGVPAALLTFSLLGIERSRRLPEISWLATLGNSSYAIYLSHGLALSAIGQLWKALDMSGSLFGWISYLLVASVAAISWGIAVHRFAEAPSGRFLASLRS